MSRCGRGWRLILGTALGLGLVVAASARPAGGGGGKGAARAPEPQLPPGLMLAEDCPGTVQDLRDRWIAPPEGQWATYYPPEISTAWDSAAADGSVWIAEEIGPTEEQMVRITAEYYGLCELGADAEPRWAIVVKAWPLPWTR